MRTTDAGMTESRSQYGCSVAMLELVNRSSTGGVEVVVASDYRTFSAPVRGGAICGGIWRETPYSVKQPLLAIHGITASHLAWLPLAKQLDDLQMIAPDLRGRGRSNTLPGPYGIRGHADDMAAVLDHFQVERSVVVAHSMGAFVAVRLANQHPERVSALVLVDGGLPIPQPRNVAEHDLPAALLGPAAKRLSMVFASRSEYRAFWQNHPAFGPYWNDEMAAYVDYDLVGDEPQLRPSAVLEAVAQDITQLSGNDGYVEALASLSIPTYFLRAPRGLLDQPTALYEKQSIELASHDFSQVNFRETTDLNHYTIVLSEQGATQIAPVVKEALSSSIKGEAS